MIAALLAVALHADGKNNPVPTKTVSWVTSLATGHTAANTADDVTWPQALLAGNPKCGTVIQTDVYRYGDNDKPGLDALVAHGTLNKPGSATWTDSAFTISWSFTVEAPCASPTPTPTPSVSPSPTTTPTSTSSVSPTPSPTSPAPVTTAPPTPKATPSPTVLATATTAPTSSPSATPTARSTSPATLPMTGAPLGLELGAGMVLLIAGGGLVGYAMRRRP